MQTVAYGFCLENNVCCCELRLTIQRLNGVCSRDHCHQFKSIEARFVELADIDV